jgi:hypothetical protein
MYIFLIYSYYAVRYTNLGLAPPPLNMDFGLTDFNHLYAKYRINMTINRLTMTDTILVKVQYADVSLESQMIPVPMPTPPNMPEPPIPPLPRAIIYYYVIYKDVDGIIVERIFSCIAVKTHIQLRSCKNAYSVAKL